MKNNSKILVIFFISLLFIFVGFYLSIKYNNVQPPRPKDDQPMAETTNYQLITNSPTPFIRGEKAKVAYVFDGDTIELSDKRRVRYIGINAPELNPKEKTPQCFATDSAKINKQLVAGQEIEMAKDISDTDKYGRLLRLVWIDGLFINEFLLRQGYAKSDLVPPDLTYAKQFQEAEKEAREEKRGLWKTCVKL